jgi:hypothetical protein
MRIPRSAIVMSLLCAVPFALALREASHGSGSSSKDRDADEDEFDSSVNEKRETMRYEQERMAELQRESQRHTEAIAAVGQVIGSEPASLGALFEGVHLGAPAGDFQPESVRAALERVHESVIVDWDVDAVRLEGLTIHFQGLEDCSPVVHAVERWGDATVSDHLWVNPKTHERASFDRYGCTLRFQRFADLDQWLDRTPSAIVPIGAVGKSFADLRQRVAGLIDVDNSDEQSFTWRDVGVAGVEGETTLTAYNKGGKVVALTAVFQADITALDAIRTRVTKLVGVKPKSDEGSGVTTWSGRAVLNEDVPSLTFGTPP